MSEWQPIETAPRDGTQVALFCNGRWYSPCQYEIAGVISEYPFWIWWQEEPVFLVEIKNPTHWMPLPDPPQLDTNQ